MVILYNHNAAIIQLLYHRSNEQKSAKNRISDLQINRPIFGFFRPIFGFFRPIFWREKQKNRLADFMSKNRNADL